MVADRIPIPRYRAGPWPALLAAGFRPFFLGASLWTAVALALWLGMLLGAFELPTLFAPMSWHAHEMLYGFVVAVVTGFLLTAIPNWTGRMPLQGMPLLGLVLLWLAGRAAVACSAWIGAAAAAAIDLGFLAVLSCVVLREVVAGRNWRNLPMVGALLALLAGNGLMHLEAAAMIADEGLGWRVGLTVMIVLISLVGGRIIPSFTRNWLAKRGSGRLPAGFGISDKLALASTAAALAFWAAWPDSLLAGLALPIAALSQAVRLIRWHGHSTFAEPLVWILHLAYAWIPVGLMLLGATYWIGALPRSLALHALTAGAIGTMTLAVMTRASLGHSGRALHADWATTGIYLAVTLAAATRLAAAMIPEQMAPLLVFSAAAWVAAFGGFAVVYGRHILLKQG